MSTTTHTDTPRRHTPALDRLLRLPNVIEMTGLGRSQLYSMMLEKRFPQPRRIGRRAVAWRESDLRAWMDGLPAADETAPA